MQTSDKELIQKAHRLDDLIQPGPFQKCGEDGDYWVENRLGQKLVEFDDRYIAVFFAESRALVPDLAALAERQDTTLDNVRACLRHLTSKGANEPGLLGDGYTLAASYLRDALGGP